MLIAHHGSGIIILILILIFILIVTIIMIVMRVMSVGGGESDSLGWRSF